jgi:hypothetical protein
MKEELSTLIKAQYPLIYLVTSEEERAEKAIADIVAEIQSKESYRVYSWTVTRGMVEAGVGHQSVQHNTVSPEAAVEWVVRQKEAGIYIFKDLHPYLESPPVTRWLRDAIASFKGTDKIIILMSPYQQTPLELEKDLIVLDFPLPQSSELDEVLEKALKKSRGKRLESKVREKLRRAALGLTIDEAEKVYRKALVMAGKLSEDEVEIVLSEKKQLIRRNGILDYIEEDETINGVGGLEELKRWLTQRSEAFTEKARDYGLPQPKGMLILGVPGCGKSLIAKTTSK